MWAALRHAAHSLRARKSDKKLLLILTDGEPADVDVQDERHLIEDLQEHVGMPIHVQVDEHLHHEGYDVVVEA